MTNTVTSGSPKTYEFRFVRLKEALKLRGVSRSRLYSELADGLFPEPVHIGRVVAWPDFEIQAINWAWLTGLSEEAIRALASALMSARKLVGGA